MRLFQKCNKNLCNEVSRVGTFHFKIWFCGTYFHVGVQMLSIAGKSMVLTTSLIIRSFVITYQIIIYKVMLLGRNSFPKTELIPLQLLLYYLVFFTYLLKCILCYTRCCIWNVHFFSLQRYKRDLMKSVLGWIVHCCWGLSWSPFKSKHNFVSKCILQGFLVCLNVSFFSEVVNSFHGKRKEGSWGDKLANFSKYF